jgi:fructokinase
MSSTLSPYHIGIDLGGTKIELAVLSGAGSVLMRERIATQAHLGPDHILDQVDLLYRGASEKYPHHTLGVGTPGSLSSLTGKLRNSNTTCLNGLALQELIEEKLKHQIRIENDANCFALAEALHGAAQGYDCVFGVIMGTGCGGGWVFNRKLRAGPQHLSGEWGHTVIDPSGLECFCGHRGCVETFISGSGVERQYAFKAGERAAPKSSEQIFYQAQVDPDSLEHQVVEDFYKHTGQALANLINTMDPDVIVLGGGLSNIKGLSKRVTEEVEKRVFTEEFKTPILVNQLGDSAGVIGAALMGADLKLNTHLKIGNN